MSQVDVLYEHMKDDLELVQPPREESQVAKYFAGKTIFITGVTGFMGKCLIEKLLRDCPGVKHIFVLMREKKNTPVDELLKKYFQNIIFDRLRKVCPTFESKVTALKGDLAEEKLGLSEADRDLIKNETNIMFHNAANVKFDIRVYLALQVNVLGTNSMLELAHECKKLEMFMYVSTAYSHPYIQDVEETFYKPPADLNEVYVMMKKDLEMKDGMPEQFMQTWLGKFPNIYTYTKAIAENLVKQHGQRAKFICGVYRPSVVINAYNEPLAGWCGNKNGPVLVFIAAGLGVLHTAYHVCYPIDLVPSDYTTNALLAVTWDNYSKGKTQCEPAVYNYGSTTVNPLTLNGVHEFLTSNFSYTETPFSSVWKPFIIFAKNIYVFWIFHILFHFIPACIVDLLLIVTGKKPKAVSLFLYATKHLDKINYFGNGNWRIHVKETVKVIDRLNAKDKEIFYCDMRKESFIWESYLGILWRGIRMYIMKEKLDSAKSYRKYIQICIVHYGAITVLVLLLLNWLMKFMS